MENNKLKVKDLVNIGIFSALYMVISMIVMIPVGIAPILWLIWPGIAGLFGGAFFTLLMTKVPKQGAALILAIITGLLYFATGECTWVIIVTFAVAGILGEAARKVLGYKSFKGIALAGGFTAFGFIGSPLPMWLFQDAYMKSIEEMGMGVEYVEGLRCFTLDNEKDEVPTKCNSGILEIDNLSVSYKNRTIFSNASFAAARGDIIAVTGRNGSGKSAFLRVLCGLMKERAGRIVFDGKPYPYKKRRELCYMTMQDVVHQLFSDSVWEEFSLLNKTVDEQEITKILRRLDLLDYKDKHPMTLSGGQKQRLALAVATLANKDIMIFDEPTSGLDYGNMIKVCELIKELSSNRIVFVATHDRELMGLLCTRRMEISNESISVYDLTTK